MSDSDAKCEEKVGTATLSFIDEWCKLYGLDSGTAEYLRERGYTTGDDVLTLYVDDIKRFTDLDDVKKWLLPSAITRYRQGREVADKQLQQKGVVITKKPKAEIKKRNVASVWRFHANNVVNKNKVALTLMSPEKREAYLSLRKRLQAVSRTMPKLPVPEQIIIAIIGKHGDTKTVDDAGNKLPLQPTVDQMSENVDKMLASLLENKPEAEAQPDDPDAPEVDLEDSQRKTEEALLKLDAELFSEEELKFVAKLRQLQEKYNHEESPEYERELADLVASM